MSFVIILQQRLSDSKLIPKKFVWYQKKGVLSECHIFLTSYLEVVATFEYWTKV